MTLNERQRTKLEIEFLNADLGRFSREMPVSTIKRDLTRSLFEHPAADPQQVISWVVEALDKVVTAWERSPAQIHQHVTNGVRQAATIITEAAERAGLTTPVQPIPEQPGVSADLVDTIVTEPATADWTPSDGGLTPSMFGGI